MRTPPSTPASRSDLRGELRAGWEFGEKHRWSPIETEKACERSFRLSAESLRASVAETQRLRESRTLKPEEMPA